MCALLLQLLLFSEMKSSFSGAPICFYFLILSILRLITKSVASLHSDAVGLYVSAPSSVRICLYLRHTPHILFIPSLPLSQLTLTAYGAPYTRVDDHCDFSHSFIIISRRHIYFFQVHTQTDISLFIFNSPPSPCHISVVCVFPIKIILVFSNIRCYMHAETPLFVVVVYFLIRAS